MKKILFTLFSFICCWNLIYSQSGYEFVYEPTPCQLHVYWHDGIGNVYLKYNFNGSGVRYVSKGEYTIEVFDNETGLSVSSLQIMPPQDLTAIKTEIELAQTNCQP